MTLGNNSKTTRKHGAMVGDTRGHGRNEGFYHHAGECEIKWNV